MKKEFDLKIIANNSISTLDIKGESALFSAIWNQRLPGYLPIYIPGMDDGPVVGVLDSLAGKEEA